jgi:DNA-binding LacI/PurR family transcriptional regulator
MTSQTTTSISDRSDKPKYQQVYSSLLSSIRDGKYKPGDKLPSEGELVKEFGASRPTVGRALARLALEGLIQRRPGAGTFVLDPKASAGKVFGLLIPELGSTEIFEPVCKGISQAHLGASHELIWGPLFDPNAPKEIQALKLCEYYLQRNLSGVFFAPLELADGKDEINLQIVSAFDKKEVPIVLLDRDIYEYPRRSRYDLVGIDNRRAGFVITEHLLDTGAENVLFFARPKSAPTVKQRISGYGEAIRSHRGPQAKEVVIFGDPVDRATVQAMISTYKPDAIVCANDLTAARLMNTLNAIGVRVPADVRITGMDDVKYASLLKVPLTTIHQPCHDIGMTALSAMLNRVAQPNAPARDFLVDFSLVIRQSSGNLSSNLALNSGQYGKTEPFPATQATD